MKKVLIFWITIITMLLIWLACENIANPLSSQGETLKELGKPVGEQNLLPEEAELISAELFIYVNQSNDKKVNIHRITTDWSEETVNWDNFANGFDGTVWASFRPDQIDFVHVDITPLFQSWVDHEYPNYGILLDQEENTTMPDYARYNSKENANNHPYLIVKYNLDGVENEETWRVVEDSYIWSILGDENRGDKGKLFTGSVALFADGMGYEKQSLLKFTKNRNQESDKCETAFAYSELANCFSEFGFHNWGWTNGPLTEERYNLPLYAGAGQCVLENGTNVGELEFARTGNSATLTFSMKSGFSINEIHIYLGENQLPTDRRGRYTVAPGQYPVVNEELQNLTEYSVTVTDLPAEIYLVAHAVVCGSAFDNDNDLANTADDRNRERGRGNSKGKNKRGQGRGKGRKGR